MVVQSWVALGVDLSLDAKHLMVVFLQPRALLLDQLAKPVRHRAVTSLDHNIHDYLPGSGCKGCKQDGGPSGRPGLRPHNRLLRCSQLVCPLGRHY